MKIGGAILRAIGGVALAGLVFGLLPPVGRAGLVADGAPAARSFGGVTRTVTARDTRGRPAELTTSFGGATPLVEAVTRRPDGRLVSLAFGLGSVRPMPGERRDAIALGGGSRRGAEALRGAREATRSTAAKSRSFRATRYPVLGEPGDRTPAAAGTFGILPPRLRVSAGASSSAGGRVPDYDAAGQRTEQEFYTEDYYRKSLYAWDAFGRLVRCEVDLCPEAWTAAYDGLGRRLTTTNGSYPAEQSVYDPAVEFLELEVRQGDAVARKLYGPDGSGGYGGHQGVGGLLAVFQGRAANPTAMVEDRFGNCVARVRKGGGWSWTYTDPVGYGPPDRWGPLPTRNATDLPFTVWLDLCADGCVARFLQPATRLLGARAFATATNLLRHFGQTLFLDG